MIGEVAASTTCSRASAWVRKIADVFRPHRTTHAAAHRTMPLHPFVLLLLQLVGFQQDRIRYCNLADIVESRGQLQRLGRLLAFAELPSNEAGVATDTQDVTPRFVIAVLRCFGQTVDGFALGDA